MMEVKYRMETSFYTVTELQELGFKSIGGDFNKQKCEVLFT